MATILEVARRVQRGEAPPPPIGRLLGFVLKEIEPGRAVFEMEAGERHHNPMGTLHGGIYCDLADAAMGYAYAATLGEGETFTTVELKINFFRPVRQGRLTAEARVVKAGSTLGYFRGRWKPLVYTVVLSGVVLAGVLVYGRFGVQRPGGNPMNDSRFMVDHVRLESDKPFEDVAKAFERQLGRFDPDVAKPLIAGGDVEEARAKIEAMAGPSGFMLFGTTDHGALLRLVGQKRKAIQYVVGNPLIALQMTQHGIRAGLYAPLRVLIYEDEQGKTCVEYDRPSSLFGQFGNDRIAPTAAMLDKKLEDLVTTAIR